MRYLIPILLSTSLLVAEENNEVDLMVLGVSHHFQNRDSYHFNEINPGLGLQYWRKIKGLDGEDSGMRLGGIVADYKNSYYKESVLVAAGARYTFGEDKGFHYGLMGGIGRLTGYENGGNGFVAAAFIGYDRIRLESTYMPFTNMQATDQPDSAVVSLWLNIVLIRY